jgi:hypothetical protein
VRFQALELNLCELVLQPWTGDQNAYVAGEAKKKKKNPLFWEREREKNKKVVYESSL